MLLKNLREEIDATLARDPAARSRLEVVLCYPGFQALVNHCLAHWLWQRGWLLAGRFVSYIGRIFTGIEIHPGARIGKRFFAHAHAIVREGCVLGDDVTLQNGAVIGADGFGFAKNSDGSWTKILQTGPAVLEDAVEVQANACVDRASVGETRIAKGAKIDNLVQVGHGSSVGENSLLCAQVGLAGSTTVGNNVILAGQVGVAGHLTIGDGAVATAQTGIPGDVAPGAVVSGYPAMDNKMWLRTVAAVNRLPELIRKLRHESQER